MDYYQSSDDESIMEPNLTQKPVEKNLKDVTLHNRMVIAASCRGIALTLGVSVFMITTYSVRMWSAYTCLFGMFLAASLSLLRIYSPKPRKSGVGNWMRVLQYMASLAILAVGLHDPLRQMELGRLLSWLSKTDSIFECMMPCLTLNVLTFLFVLGLERSRLLCKALLIATVIFYGIINLGIAWSQIKAAHCNLNYQVSLTTTLELRQILESAAFFSVAFSVTTDVGTFPLKTISIVSLGCMLCVCFGCFLFLTIYFEQLDLIKYHISYFNAVEHLNALYISEELRHLWIFRDLLAVMSVVCMSLSLVEVFSAGQRSVLSLAGDFLPPSILAENVWTGTRVMAILFTGMVSSFLTVTQSAEALLFMCSSSFVISYVCDVMFMMVEGYKPVYFPPLLKDARVEKKPLYVVLPNMEPLVGVNMGSEEELVSNDSGHSSDTDIDTVVHEYRDAVEIARPITDPPIPRGPTVYDSIKLKLLITAMALFSAGLTFSIRFNFGSSITAIFAVAILVTILLIWQHPINLSPKSSITTSFSPSPLLPCLSLCFSVMLSLQLIPVFLIIWTGLGLIIMITHHYGELKLKHQVLPYLEMIKGKFGIRVNRNFAFQHSLNELNQKDPIRDIP